MNLLELVLKQMRQRLLSTLLTCVSITLGMTLATGVLILGREGQKVFAQTDYGFDMLVGPKGSVVTLVMNTIYHLDTSQGNIPYWLYEDIATGREISGRDGGGEAGGGLGGKVNPFRGMVEWAVPFAVGDSYKGRRIVGTTPQLFGVDDAGKPLPSEKIPRYRREAVYRFAQGRAFAPNKFEAVIGSEVARGTGLTVGSTFHATHGIPAPGDIPDVHDETWSVVGILQETHTANDKVLFIPLMTFYAIFEHEAGLEKIGEIQRGAASMPVPATIPAPVEQEPKAYTTNADGTINVKLPREQWEVSAILVQTKSPKAMIDMNFILKNLPEAVGVNPAAEMEKFFDTFLPNVMRLLLLISGMVMVVGAVSILVSIYNSVTARGREIAIMRALGATRVRILAAVCVEAALVGLIGGLVGLFAGHALAAAASAYLQRWMGSGIPWWRVGPAEMIYLCVVLAISLMAGFVPAMKAYATQVAENLVG